MATTGRTNRYDVILLVIFLVLFILESYFVLSGLAWNTIESGRITYSILILVTLAATTAGIVFTYSVVSYVQRKEIKHLIFLFWGANMVLIAFLFLITHPSSVWSPFCDRDRNRTIVTALGFLLTPGLLAISLTGNKLATRKDKIVTSVWGLLGQPAFSLILLISPTPLFQVTSEVGGVIGLTPIGWLNTIVVLAAALLSIFISFRKWLVTHDRNLLSIVFAVVLWLEALVIYTILENPNQIAEALWFSGVTAGFMILGVGMILTSIIEPYRFLQTLVESRTEELEISKKEIEYTLDMWTHKLGNLLQSITSYLELLDIALEDNQDPEPIQTIVSELNREATIINRQVAKLAIIKKNQHLATYPVRIAHILDLAIAEVRPLISDTQIVLENQSNNNSQINVDALIDILFVNIILYCVRFSIGKNSKMEISIRRNDKGVSIRFSISEARPIDKDLAYLRTRGIVSSHSVSLEIYLISILIERYQCKLSYSREDSEAKNVIEIYFPK
ncbi:MAG: hypothetical protein GF411_06140 [Candidatus Lokiarchaeota archaeon]|nr:hypothetical protein [Candidatus Lokiarchaeota archaeon]